LLRSFFRGRGAWETEIPESVESEKGGERWGITLSLGKKFIASATGGT
jgi:hypothetical protein